MAQKSLHEIHAPPTRFRTYFTAINDLLSTPQSEKFFRRNQDFSRSGILTPELMICLLLYLVADAGRRGYKALLDAFWDECQTFGIQLDGVNPVSAAAFCQARPKIEPALIHHLMQSVAEEFESLHGPAFRLKGHRVFAVDGDKVTVQRSDALFDALGWHCDAHCPQMLLSTLYNTLSGVIHDHTIAPTHSSERDELLAMLGTLSADDILTLDRGYPSFPVFSELLDRGIHFVARLPASSTFRPVENFLESGQKDGTVRIAPPEGMRRSHSPIDLRIVVLDRPDGTSLILATDLSPEEFTGSELGDVYHLRWTVEELYKLESGSYLGQGQFHAKTLDGVKQEVCALGLFINMTRIFTASAAAEVNKPYRHIYQKTAVLAVAAYITRLLLEEREDEMARLVSRLVQRIGRTIVKPRPGRHYPRRSFKPPPKWTPSGKRGGK